MRSPCSALCPLLGALLSLGCAEGAPPLEDPPGTSLDGGAVLVVVTCEEVTEHARRGGSDDVLCFLPPDGCHVEIDACCALDFLCIESDGSPADLMRTHQCAKGCDTSCERLLSAETCRLSPGCEWLDETACEPAPEGYLTGQRCIPQRGVACFDERDCDEGWSCERYWVSLCEDDEPECSRCAVESRRCTSPR